MGMNFSPMYQPITSSNLTVDGDLKLGKYDIFAADGKFDTVEAAVFTGVMGDFTSLTTRDSLFPKYNISRISSGKPRVTFDGVRYGSTQNQVVGTKTWYNDVIYASQRNNSLFTLAHLSLDDYIPITINSLAANPTARYVALFVDGKEVLRTTSEGSKTYQLGWEDFDKVIRIDCYIDKSGYAADINNATIGSGYIN